MAKKLSDIEQQIEKKKEGFIYYLKTLLDIDVFTFISKLNEIDNLYLFSGVIRNYFLGLHEVRDVDIMINSDQDINNFVASYCHRKNSFGGYKVYINDTTIDLWYLKDTWGLHNSQKVLNFDLEKYIPNTAFFNFSSIIYSFQENNFIYSKYFLRFLRDKKIDYVFEANPQYDLCVVNSFYYHDKLKLGLTDRLKTLLFKIDKRYNFNYESIQLKHFGRVIYSSDYIKKEINEMVLQKKTKHQYKLEAKTNKSKFIKQSSNKTN